MQYNNFGEKNEEFVTRTSQVNKDGMHLTITKLNPIYDGNNFSLNYNIFNDNNDFLGNILLKHSEDDLLTEAEIEYYSVPDFKNKGNITVALKDVLKDAFTTFSQITTIYLNIAPSNIASKKVATNCGFDQKEYSRRYYVISKDKVLNNPNGDDVKELNNKKVKK